MQDKNVYRVLGLDASTTTIGVSVIDYTIHPFKDIPSVKLIHNSFFKPPKKGEIFNRLNVVREFIKRTINEWNPNYIALEDIVLFMKGFSTAKTITALAVLNRTVGLAIYDTCGKPPHLLNVMKIRHTIKKDKELPSKEDIPELVAFHLGIEFPWIYKVNKKTGEKEKIKENNDIADGIAVALAFIKINTELKKPKKIIKIRKKKV